MNEELEKLKEIEKKIADEIVDSNEYKRLKAVVEAIKQDDECQKILNELKNLQASCRSKQTSLDEKKQIVKRINELKDILHALPLWVNYLSFKDDYERMINEVKDKLENLD